MTSKLSLLAQFSTEPEAFMAQGMLEENGIRTFMDTNRMSTLYAAGATWSPINLYVDADDQPRALELLKEHGDIE